MCYDKELGKTSNLLVGSGDYDKHIIGVEAAYKYLLNKKPGQSEEWRHSYQISVFKIAFKAKKRNK